MVNPAPSASLAALQPKRAFLGLYAPRRVWDSWRRDVEVIHALAGEVLPGPLLENAVDRCTDPLLGTAVEGALSFLHEEQEARHVLTLSISELSSEVLTSGAFIDALISYPELSDRLVHSWGNLSWFQKSAIWTAITKFLEEEFTGYAPPYPHEEFWNLIHRCAEGHNVRALVDACSAHARDEARLAYLVHRTNHLRRDCLTHYRVGGTRVPAGVPAAVSKYLIPSGRLNNENSGYRPVFEVAASAMYPRLLNDALEAEFSATRKVEAIIRNISVPTPALMKAAHIHGSPATPEAVDIVRNGKLRDEVSREALAESLLAITSPGAVMPVQAIRNILAAHDRYLMASNDLTGHAVKALLTQPRRAGTIDEIRRLVPVAQVEQLPSYCAGYVAEHFEETLGDHPHRWDLALELLDGGWSGSLEELAESVRAATT